jgi:LacI family transcriptional regulator
MIKILLLIDYASEFDRKLLKGLVQFSKENGPWLFYRLPSYYKKVHGIKGVIQFAKKWKADAIIGQWDAEKDSILDSLKIPVILQNYHHRSTKYSNITGDYKGTGLMAAQFFIRRRFSNFAYFGIKDVVWSDERMQGYKQEIERVGGTYYSFESNKTEDEIRADVSKWLKSLPKPIALFCCDDEQALFISELCYIENLKIPDDISLLGVDNDNLICNISDPPISSIELEVEKGGYAVGRRVYQLITKEEKGPFNIVVNPIRIELRQSTEKHNIKDMYVLEMVKYIEANYKSDLSIDDLIAHYPLSRRNIEIRFKRAMNTTIYQFLLNCRIDHFADLLITTNRPIIDLSIEVGFKDYNNISRLFKKYKGCSPAEYRKK